jgi:hypothetical protein
MQALVSSCSCSGHAGVEGDHVRCWQDHHVAARGDDQQAAALAALASMPSVHRSHFTQLIAPSVRNRHSLRQSHALRTPVCLTGVMHLPTMWCVQHCAQHAVRLSGLQRRQAFYSRMAVPPVQHLNLRFVGVLRISMIWSPGIQQQPVHHALPAVTLFVTATSCT